MSHGTKTAEIIPNEWEVWTLPACPYTSFNSNHTPGFGSALTAMVMQL